jgi:hypothetical protein
VGQLGESAAWHLGAVESLAVALHPAGQPGLPGILDSRAHLDRGRLRCLAAFLNENILWFNPVKSSCSGFSTSWCSAWDWCTTGKTSRPLPVPGHPVCRSLPGRAARQPVRRPIFYDRTLIWLTIPLFLVLAAGIAQFKQRMVMHPGAGGFRRPTTCFRQATITGLCSKRIGAPRLVT